MEKLREIARIVKESRVLMILSGIALLIMVIIVIVVFSPPKTDNTSVINGEQGNEVDRQANVVKGNLEVLNKAYLSNMVITDLEKPIDVKFNREYELAKVAVEFTPRVELIKRFGATKADLLLYPNGGFLGNTTYRLIISEGGRILFEGELKTLPALPTPTIIYTDNIKPKDFDEEQLERDYENSKDKIIEAELRESVPVKEDGFTLDYTYKKSGMFIVTLDKPYEVSQKKFDDWFIKMGLKDRSHFQVIKGK